MIAPTTARLEDAVAELVAAGSGVDYDSVLSGNKGTPVPDGLFASLALIHQAIEGMPATVMSLASGDTDLNAPTVATGFEGGTRFSGSAPEHTTRPTGCRCGSGHLKGRPRLKRPI